MPTEEFLKGYSESSKHLGRPLNIDQANPYDKESENEKWIEWRNGWFDALMDSTLHLGK